MITMTNDNTTRSGTEPIYNSNCWDYIVTRRDSEDKIPKILDVFDYINQLYFCFKNEFKNIFERPVDVFIKRYRMDRLIGKREKRIGLKR